MKQNFGISLPEKMREEVGYLVKHVSDEEHKELSPQWVYEIFEDKYVKRQPYFQIEECHFKQVDGIMAEATIVHGGQNRLVAPTEMAVWMLSATLSNSTSASAMSCPYTKNTL